jgi:hypothetical protein
LTEAVFLERREVIVDLARHDVDVDGMDMERRRLRRGLVARDRLQQPCRSGERDGGSGCRD